MKLFNTSAATPPSEPGLPRRGREAGTGVPAAETAPPSRERYDGVSGTRRSFLQKLGAAAAIIGLGGFAYQALRSLVPNVLYEPPKRFKIGTPANLAEGMTFLEDRKLYVFKQGNAVYSISAVCTHLGCTVKYFRLNGPETVEVDGQKKTYDFEFHCPCHGSMYYGDGTNYAGPAPRPLHWYKMEVSPDDGQLLVDLGTEVDQNFRLTV